MNFYYFISNYNFIFHFLQRCAGTSTGTRKVPVPAKFTGTGRVPVPANFAGTGTEVGTGLPVPVPRLVPVPAKKIMNFS